MAGTVFLVSAAVAALLPATYRSTATILIEQQEMPADLVRSTISDVTGTDGGIGAYGEFQRMIPLPTGIDREKAKAGFKNGVLTLTLPKLPEAKSNRKKIEITTG